MTSISYTAKKHLSNELRQHLISFAITVCAMTIFCIIMRITPFGDNTFLYDDVRREFIQYYAYLKNAILGDGSLAYSRTKGMGGSMLGLYVNYISSPLNLIYVLFPVKMFPTVLTILLIFRMGLSSFTANVFLTHANVKRSVPFSVSFSMSLWVFVSVLNPLWLDAIIMFPLLACAVLEFSRDTKSVKKLLALVLLTSVQFYLNYYTACMMMIFFAIWMILRFIMGIIRFTDGLKVATGLITGILLICPVIYPVYQELTLSEKSVGGSFISLLFTDAHITNPLMVISKLFSFSIDGQQVMFGMPHLFCGTVMLPLLVFFFINKDIDKAIKKQCGILLSMLFVSFCISPLDLIWHAGNVPNGYPYRYAFLFVAVMITCCAYSFDIILDHYIGKKYTVPVFTNIQASFAITCIIEIIVLVFSRRLNMGWFSVKSGIISLLILAAEYILCHILMRKDYKFIYAIFALICICDLMVNQIKIVRASYMPCETLSEYQARYDDKSSKIESIKDKDDSFYRIEDIESDPYDNINDGMVYDYHSISHYSTGDHKSVRMFLKSLGFNYNQLYDKYLAGNTKTADSILNVKYLLTSEGTIQNTDIFPTAVAISSNSYLPSNGVIDDPFYFQTLIARAFAGIEDNNENTDNSDLFVAACIDNMKLSSSKEEQIATMTIDLTTNSDGNIYFYLQDLGNTSQNMIVSIDGVEISGYANASAIKILDLGYRDKGQHATITLTAYGDPAEADFGYPLIFTENMEVLSKYCDMSSSASVEIVEASATKLVLKKQDTDSIYSDDNNIILLSIPYENGFTAYGADTKESFEVSQAFGALTIIKVPEGYAGDIVLDYHIPGTKTGFILLIVGLVLLLIQYILYKPQTPVIRPFHHKSAS